MRLLFKNPFFASSRQECNLYVCFHLMMKKYVCFEFYTEVFTKLEVALLVQELDEGSRQNSYLSTFHIFVNEHRDSHCNSTTARSLHRMRVRLTFIAINGMYEHQHWVVCQLMGCGVCRGLFVMLNIN